MFFLSSISENVLKETFGLFQRDVELVSRKHFSLGWMFATFSVGEVLIGETWNSMKTGFTFFGKLQKKFVRKRIETWFSRVLRFEGAGL